MVAYLKFEINSSGNDVRMAEKNIFTGGARKLITLRTIQKRPFEEPAGEPEISEKQNPTESWARNSQIPILYSEVPRARSIQNTRRRSTTGRKQRRKVLDAVIQKIKISTYPLNRITFISAFFTSPRTPVGVKYNRNASEHAGGSIASCVSFDTPKSRPAKKEWAAYEWDEILGNIRQCAAVELERGVRMKVYQASRTYPDFPGYCRIFCKKDGLLRTLIRIICYLFHRNLVRNNAQPSKIEASDPHVR